MSDEEYQNYLKESLLEFCGQEVLDKKPKISKEDILSVEKYEFDKKNYRIYFRVKNRSGYYITTVISVRNGKIFTTSCQCVNYYNDDMCEHIYACLYYYLEEILPKPPTKEEISLEILKLFKNDNKKKKENKIKQKMNLDVEISLDYKNTFKLHIGVDKTYVINTDRKFKDFINSYKNHEYRFGAKFTYDPNVHYFSDEDERLFKFLSSENEYSNTLELSDRELEFLLDKLKNKSFKLSNYGVIKNIEYKMPPMLKLEKIDDTFTLRLEGLNDCYIPDSRNFDYFAYKNTLYIVSEEEKKLLYSFYENGIYDINFNKRNLNLFKTGLLPTIKNSLEVAENIDEIVITSKPDVKIYIDFNRTKIEAIPKFDYKGNVADYFGKSDNIIRDEETEETVVKDLITMNFVEGKKAFFLEDIDDIGYFLERGIFKLKEKYEIYTSKKIDATSFEKKKNITSTFSIGKDGIMSYTFDTDGIKEEELTEIFSSLKNKKKYYKMKNGNLLKLEDNEDLSELNDVLNDLNLKVSDFEGGSATIPKYRAFYIDSLKNNKYGIISTDNSFDEFIDRFKKYKNAKFDFDDFDKNTLRDYQKDGVKWLYTLYKCDLGGILADEMGLGKSIQTISFIKQILKEKRDAKIMIVCPTSLVYNWKKEFEKFAPHLKYVTVAENKQKRKKIIEKFDEYNIFITSYGLIRNDNDEYEDKEFELCVIDEAQAIKNYQANMTKEIKKVKASCKIALTGTPIENSIFELWSIFDFIMPGYLNNITSFRENYGIKDIDDDALERLAKLNYQIKPFILRRKKNEVSKDLPDKIENNIYLDLPDKQKALYMKVVKETEKELEELVNTEGYSKARFKILQLLTKLRQICINPNIVYTNYDGESVKLERLTEIVKDLVQDKHKILIFSSFKTVIDSVKEIFDKESISNYVIAGDVKSKTRMELVDKFNSDDTNCFLITLKSGGTGLNLTSADIVIHLDIWWNPQAENQATDRAHRIGQTKNVTVIKLITRGTIEEKIIELQEKKKKLSDNLIEGKNDSQTISNISESEMKELLAIGQD